MPENIKYVISKTEDNAKFYLCPHEDGNVGFYSFPDEEHYEWEKENLFNAVKFFTASLARSYADSLSNATVQAVIWEDDVGCFGGYKLEEET